MEILNFAFSHATEPVRARAHVGVVASGDLEVLLEPVGEGAARVRVTTSVDGCAELWQMVLERFFAQFHGAVSLELNDFGATPGVVTLRLQQAVEKSRKALLDNGDKMEP